MASLHEAQEPPTKRRRLSIDSAVPNGASAASIPQLDGTASEGHGVAFASEADDEHAREVKAGITAFVAPHEPGFSGVLKQRYTDFIVNEILPDGRVLHLKTLGASTFHKRDNGSAAVTKPFADSDEHVQIHHQTDKEEGAASENHEPGAQSRGASGLAERDSNTELSDDDMAALISTFGETVTENIVLLYRSILDHPSRKPKDFNSVSSEPIAEKDRRTTAHGLVRRVFNSKLETKTSENNTFHFTAASRAPEARGGDYSNATPRVKTKFGWAELGGDYLHFTLYKENKDTMEVISFLAGQLKVNVKHFQFSGTKDRRAVTAQRCSAYRVRAEQLAAIGRRLRGSKVGDFEYCPTGLELGDLDGNEFAITLRDCHAPGDEGLTTDERVAFMELRVRQNVETFKREGFLNYYGLQRFGSFAASTDEIGLKLLQGNLSGAVDSILSFNPAALEASDDVLISADDRARAEALHIWATTKDSAQAVEKLPRKFSAEYNIIRHLGLRSKGTGAQSSLNDFQGALTKIPRNLRLMYVHAYQSKIWNILAGKRWELYGPHVVEGDLVLLTDYETKTQPAVENEPTVDEQGEPIILPTASNNIGAGHSSESPFQRARALSASEALSGAYTIFDIVLPLPGYDVTYPPNAIGGEYKTVMAGEHGGGLDPYDMRRSWKELSLSGSYRKLLARPGSDMSFEVKTYERVEEQLVETDLQHLQREGGGATTGGNGVENGATDLSQSAPHDTGKKLAVVLRMKLGVSQYATMALRELMKQGGVITYKPDFGGGR